LRKNQKPALVGRKIRGKAQKLYAYGVQVPVRLPAGEQLTRIHLGYFCELDDIFPENWEDAISIVEPILIKSYMPALNGKEVKGFLENPDTNILIFNWGAKGILFPEVSNLRCSGYYHDCDKYNFERKILIDEAGFNGRAK
jgi:hypothetical protein